MNNLQLLKKVNKSLEKRKITRALGQMASEARYLSMGEKLRNIVKEIVRLIWEAERMPEDWRVSIICPIHKKKDKTGCNNCRAVTLAYKTFSKIL